MRRSRIPLLLLVLLGAMPTRGAAQTARLIPVDDPAGIWIARLQERGYLTGLHPTAQPYAWDEVVAAVHTERIDASDPVALRWLDRLSRRLGDPVATGSGWIGAELRPGVRATSNGRLDPLRILDGGTPVYTWGTLHLDASGEGFTLSGGLRHDLYYDRDPDGLDSVLRLYMRSDHSYAGYRRGLLMLHLGRFDTHWGPADGPGLVLSDYPRSMDAIHLRIGGSRLALRSTFAELDAVTADGRFTGTAGADSVSAGAERRWLAAHRIDWRPTASLALTLAESVLFSGVGSGFSLKYLNPLQPAFLAVDNRPKNDENNGLLAAMLWWRPADLVVTGQLLLDDFDFVNGDEPASAAGAVSLVRPGIKPWLDAGLTATAVTARAYGSPQPEGRYVHLGRGIGAPFADFVDASVFARMYLERILPGLSVEPVMTVLWQGEHDYRLPYPGEELGTILTGTVEQTLRIAVRVGVDFGVVGRLRVDAGINRVSNASHIEGRNRTVVAVTGGVSLRLALAGPFRFAP